MNSNTMDFNNYKFRCSSIGKLMVSPRSKSEILSETTKSYLSELWIEARYDRKRELTNKYLEKGTLVEDSSIDLLCEVEGIFYSKNTKHYENEYIQGTPDIVDDNEVIDIKSSWDIWTFAKADGENTDYYYQLLGYCALTKKRKARLVYTLVSAPEHLIIDELRVRVYRSGLLGREDTQEYADLEDSVYKNMVYDDIDKVERVKPFVFDFTDTFEQEYKKVQDRIVLCREYMNTIKL